MTEHPLLYGAEPDGYRFPDSMRRRYRRLSVFLACSICLAALIELAGRILYMTIGASYGITGPLTLAAIALWGTSTVYAVYQLPSLRRVARLLMAGAGLLLASQTISLLTYVLSPLSDAADSALGLLEESTFVFGLACLFGGSYMSLFKADRAAAGNEIERRNLAAEVLERTKAQDALGQLRDDLEREQANLRELNEQLEHRVRERTAELLRTNADLRNSIERNATILRIAMSGFLVSDVDTGRILEVNDAMCRIVGYSRTELLSMTISGLDVNEDPIELKKHFDQIIRHCSERFETRHRRKDGSIADIEVSTTYIPGSQALFSFCRDITETKRAAQALALSEAKYRELVQNANSIILRMDCSGNVKFFNEFAQQFFGFTEDEIVGKNVIGTIVPATGLNGRDLTAMIRDIGQQPEKYAANENENTLRDGRRVWIAWTNKPIGNPQGGIEEILCVGNDITSRVLAEHTVAQQQMKMVESARLSALGASTSTIVHEINNPITVMATGAEQLRSLLDDPVGNLPRMRDICDMIERNNSRIQRIIHGLRSLSREGSHDPFMMASLQTILEETLEVCRERFRQYGVTLRMPDAFPGTEIQCRSPQLCQVLINVLNNAVEAVQHQKDGWVALGAADEGDTITIAVTDSGPGFDAEVREKAFEPFFSTKHEQKGLGLGLSISKNIIEAHNGNIAVDPRCANTRIVITLPKRHTAAR